MSIVVPLPHGTAEVDDSCTWGQIERLAEIRLAALADPTRQASAIADTCTVFTTGWAITGRDGRPIPFGDVRALPATDVTRLFDAITRMVKDVADIDVAKGADQGAEATPPANPTPAPPSGTPPTDPSP